MSKNMNARGEGIFNDAAFAVGVIPPYCVDRTRRSASKSSRGIGNPCETRLNLHRTRPKESDGRGFCAMCTGRVVRVGYDTVTLRINDRSHVRACDWAGRERYMKIGLGWLLHPTSDDLITELLYVHAFLLRVWNGTIIHFPANAEDDLALARARQAKASAGACAKA